MTTDVDRFLGLPDEPPVRIDRGLTIGEWATEAESVEALDELLAKLGMFYVYNEVCGYYLQPRLGQDLKTPRIDKILVPKPRLIAAGWTHGPVGIECKRSGAKIGPALAQLADYSRAAWLIDPPTGMWVMPAWYFLWPLAYQYGPVASFQAQHRVGSAAPNRHGGLDLSTGTMPAVGTFNPDGHIRIGQGLNGRKSGSR